MRVVYIKKIYFFLLLLLLLLLFYRFVALLRFVEDALHHTPALVELHIGHPSVNVNDRPGRVTERVRSHLGD